MKNGAPDSPTKPTIYMPYVQDETYHDLASMSLFVRTLGNPLMLAEAIRIRIHAIQADQPVDEIQSMQDVVSNSLAARRYSLSLLSAFAGLTLLLSAVGIYAIVSWTTLQRTREFGIRMALGATRAEVMAVAFRQGLQLSFAGTAIGICVASLMTQALAQLLFGVSPLDPASFCSAVVLFVAIGLGACILPAIRSASIDPARALRGD
jgi:putative ABC transport system permease protein